MAHIRTLSQLVAILFLLGFTQTHLRAMPVVGDIYVSDHGGTITDQITPGGVVTTYVNENVLSPSPNVQWLTFRNDGTLLTTNTGGINATQQVSPSGVVTVAGTGGTFGGFLNTGIAIDPNNDNDMLFGSSGNGIAQENVQTGVATAFESTADTLGAMTFGGSGDLYVADTTAGEILHYSALRVKFGITPTTIYASGLGSVSGLAFDAAGNLFTVNGTNVITEVATNGTVSTYDTLSGAFSSATLVGVAVDAAGDLYMTNVANQTVLKVTPALVTSTFASGFSNPLGIVVFGAPVPEPTSMAMLIGGAGLLASVVRRRRN